MQLIPLMKRGLGLLTLAMLGLTAVAGLAEDTTFSEGPLFTPRDRRLIVSGMISNLDDQEAIVVVEARATASVICRDASGNVVKRNRMVPGTVRFDDVIPVEMIAAGNAAFFAMSGEPILDTKLASCGNPKWTARVEDVVFRSAVVTVTQGGKTVLRREFQL